MSECGDDIDDAFSTIDMMDDVDDDPSPLPSPIIPQTNSARAGSTHASTNLEEIKGMLNVLLTKVSENEKAINALKEEIK